MEKKSLFLVTENDINSKTIGKIQNSKNAIVVPLTFKTIKFLKEKKIKFEIFDDLLSPKDHENIDSTIYNIGRTWWDHNSIKKIFEYKGLNIAQMIESELIVSLLKFGHRICLIEKIILEIKPNIVYVSESTKSISRIHTLFNKEFKFEIKNITSNSDEKNFRNDDFTIGFDLLSKNLDLTISRKKFFVIKKYYEIFWNYCYKLSIKQKNQKKGKKILLLDFNLITNKSTLENLSKSEFNLLLANTRRPIIWNQESLKIAKKLNFKNIKLGYNTNGIHPKLIEMFEKFDKVLKTDNFFAKKFSIKNISFWEIFQDDFVLFCKKRFSEILFFIDSLNKLLVKEDIKLLITLDDSQQIGRTATIFCNKKKIPSILSLNADINIFNDNKRKWEVFTLHKIYADKFAIYGELAKQLCLNHNIDSSKLVITGNPRYDELFKRNIIPDKKNILISLSGIASTAWSTFFSTPMILKYEKMFKQVLKSLAKYEKNVTIKLHPTQDSIIDVKGIIKEILPNAKISKNGNTYDLIAQSDVIITPPSSVITEALILNKPVFLFKFLEGDSGIPYEKYNAVLATENEDQIDEKIRQILFDEKIRDELTLGRQKFLKYALEYQGVASQEIIKLIKNMIK